MEHPIFEHNTDLSQINSKPLWSELSHYQWLVVTGVDASVFLNGQATIKMINQPDHAVQFGAFCNLKGRVLASFWAFQFSAQHIQLLLAPTMADAMAMHLRKYAVFSKVQLAVRPATGLIGCFANLSASESPAINTMVPINNEEWVARLYKPFPFFFMHHVAAPTNQASKLSFHAWEGLLAAHGLVMIDDKQKEQWLPQQLNYDLFGAVSFDKGCYTGQEVVARLHYRGKSKDRLRSGIVAKPFEPSYPHTIKTVTGDTAGNLLSICALSHNQMIVNTIVKTDMLEGLNHDSSIGPIQWIEPKYAIPDQ